MRVDVKVTGLDSTTKWLQALARERLPNVTAIALNATATDFQKAEREGMAAHFTLRRKQWAERAVKVSRFAKWNDTPVHATVAIEAPGDPERSSILAKFEEGGEKRARSGGALAIPDQARRTKADIIRKDQRPRAFGFVQVGSGPKAKTFAGKNRTFMIQVAGGKGGGIFRRTGKGKRSKLVRLFGFGKTARIDRRLGFYDTARRTVAARFVPNAEAALARVLRK